MPPKDSKKRSKKASSGATPTDEPAAKIDPAFATPGEAEQTQSKQVNGKRARAPAVDAELLADIVNERKAPSTPGETQRHAVRKRGKQEVDEDEEEEKPVRVKVEENGSLASAAAEAASSASKSSKKRRVSEIGEVVEQEKHTKHYRVDLSKVFLPVVEKHVSRGLAGLGNLTF